MKLYSSVICIMLSLSSNLFAWDVGFSDSPFILLTHIEWAANEISPSDKFKFSVCPIRDDRIQRKDCIQLSTCAVTRERLEPRLEKAKDEKLRTEFELLLSGSYQSELPLKDFITPLLQILGDAAEKECIIVRNLKFPKPSDHKQ